MSPTLNRSIYELAGGEQTFRLLVERFYARVAEDPRLRAVYPEEDLSGATERLTLFLMQYWGGPNTYSERRGHPGLRMPHPPFGIGQPERRAGPGPRHDPGPPGRGPLRPARSRADGGHGRCRAA